MAVTLKSTKAKVRDPEKVREILDSYKWQGVEIELQEEACGWTLEMAYHDEDPDCLDWPEALLNEEVPGQDEYPDMNDLLDAEFELYLEKGQERFLALLRELAEQLESPLLILHAVASPCHGFAYNSEVWRVQPGSKEVETLAV